MSANAESQTPQQPGSKKGKRKGALLLLTLLFIIIAVAYGIYWFLVLRHYEETDDAYVAGNQVQIMAQVAGSVTKVWADNTDYVQKGDPLVTLDRTDAQQAFEKAKTQLAASVRQTRQQMINSKQLQANIDVKKTALAQAQADLNRRIPLGAANLIGREELQHARDTVASAQAELDVAIQQYNANQAIVLGTRLEQQPAVLQAATEVRNAWLALQRTQIVSPISGYVSRRSVQPGAQNDHPRSAGAWPADWRRGAHDVAERRLGAGAAYPPERGDAVVSGQHAEPDGETGLQRSGGHVAGGRRGQQEPADP